MGRPGWGTCDLGAELHGARRSGWRELHDPEAVVEGKVGVEPPSEGGVERLGAVGISHGDDDRLELQTDSCATFRRRCSSRSPLVGSSCIVAPDRLPCTWECPSSRGEVTPAFELSKTSSRVHGWALLVQPANDERLHDVGDPDGRQGPTPRLRWSAFDADALPFGVANPLLERVD